MIVDLKYNRKEYIIEIHITMMNIMKTMMHVAYLMMVVLLPKDMF